MKLFKTLLLTTATLWTLTGCCWTDHSETIKEVAEPMLVELKTFYWKNKRFPSTEERNEMLEKVGCRMHGDKCKYRSMLILLGQLETSYDYTINFKADNSYCVLHYIKKTNRNVVNCHQQPCIKFGQ